MIQWAMRQNIQPEKNPTPTLTINLTLGKEPVEPQLFLFSGTFKFYNELYIGKNMIYEIWFIL
mgnify:CR=1 FL=1